jgi:D-alanine-D-alanine ligase
MKNKLRVALLFGGRSAEHEISLISARNIVEAMDKRKYQIIAIGIDKAGRWFIDEGGRLLKGTHRLVRRRGKGSAALIPGAKKSPLIQVSAKNVFREIDVVFPVLHGPFGEDGTVQGLLKLADLPFVGAGVLGSAIGMDKDVMKRLLRDAKLPLAKFLVCAREDGRNLDFNRVKGELGLPVFVKPANLGSSVGISKAGSEKQFKQALKEAFRFDHKILIEEAIKGREIECSVLGNENPLASLPGEIVTRHDFYSYKAKYIDDQGAELIIPARLSAATVREIQEIAIQTFKVLCCEGMARVDFFLNADGKVFVNEINTIPGFTNISMYPKLWEVSGMSYSALIDRLISLALERFHKEKKLRTSI